MISATASLSGLEMASASAGTSRKPPAAHRARLVETMRARCTSHSLRPRFRPSFFPLPRRAQLPMVAHPDLISRRRICSGSNPGDTAALVPAGLPKPRSVSRSSRLGEPAYSDANRCGGQIADLLDSLGLTRGEDPTACSHPGIRSPSRNSTLIMHEGRDSAVDTPKGDHHTPGS